MFALPRSLLPNFNTNDGGRSSDDGAAAAAVAGDDERRDLRRSVTTLLDAMQVVQLLTVNIGKMPVNRNQNFTL